MIEDHKTKNDMCLLIQWLIPVGAVDRSEIRLLYMVKKTVI